MSCADSFDDIPPDESPGAEPAPLSHDPNVNEPLSRDAAYSIAIDFGMVFGVRLVPKHVGVGFSALVPMELLKRYLPDPREPLNRTLRNARAPGRKPPPAGPGDPLAPYRGDPGL